MWERGGVGGPGEVWERGGRGEGWDSVDGERGGVGFCGWVSERGGGNGYLVRLQVH